MIVTRNLTAVAAAAGLSLFGLAGGARADDPFTYSFNVGVTTDYVFRGYSQKKEDPALQGGVDLSYAVMKNVTAYFGVWASGIDFGDNTDGSRIVGAEVDIYGGIKPVLGPATFDFGVIWYAYPGARDGGPAASQVFEQDYVEFKAGVSGAFIPGLDKLTTGATVFYSPEYQGKQGDVVTVEGTAAYELPKVWVFTPTVSGLVGAQFGDSKGFTQFTLGNGADNLVYWNAGITLGLEKFSFDFRYWDTNITDSASKGGVAGWCTGAVLQCDERFVFTAKFTY